MAFLHFDSDGQVQGDEIDPEMAAPIIVAEAVSSGLATGTPKSPTLDVVLNPPPPIFPTAPSAYAGVTPAPVGVQPGGEIVPVSPEAVSLDIERLPDNKRLLPDGFYAQRARPVRLSEITADQVIIFLNNLEELGLWEMAAARAGLNKRIVDKIRKFDADFKEACDRAMAAYVDKAEKKITDRAIDGWDEPQWSHKTGVQLGTVRKFDSRLAELVLKRLNPAYRERFEGEVKVTGGVMVVPGRANSVEDFMKLQQMDVIDGEIVPNPPVDGSPSVPVNPPEKPVS